MQSVFDKLAASLFNKKSLSECSEEELREVVREYPFFSCGHALLYRFLKEKSSPDAEKELQKTSLYFDNPLWFTYLVNQKPVEEKTGATVIEFPEAEESNNDEIVIDNTVKRFPATPTEQAPAPPAEQAEEQAEEPKESTELVFEPYHTVDYFASQGIRQQEETREADRFGKQLRSFTDWLKTIRKLTPAEIAALSDTGNEEKVIRLADESVENNDVETEAMADVWIKQGNPEKAISIYNKLSLKNPAKSSYFAGLIEKLRVN